MESIKNKKTFDNKFWKFFIPYLIITLLILAFPFLFTSFGWFGINFENTGQIGDTIGGILGPFVAICASILTFFAFWVQYKANEQQKADLKLERFESKFYELLAIHQSNINELHVGDKMKGRKIFIHMFYELRMIYKSSEKRIDLLKLDSNNINLINFSYNIFFFGIGTNSEKNYVNSFNKDETKLFEEVKKEFGEIQDNYETHIAKHKTYYTYNLPLSHIPDENNYEFHYFPFDGHANKLGHYFRHLYLTCSYVVSQSIIDDEEKYEFIKTIRAQLSNFEQLIIYYNALAWFDKEWRDINTKYRFIKNLPLALADFDISPIDFYKTEIAQLKSEKINVFNALK